MADRNDRRSEREEARERGDRRDDRQDRDASAENRKVVYALTERDERTFWTRIGVAFVSKKDNSITAILDAFPVSGKLQIRDPEPREERDER